MVIQIIQYLNTSIKSVQQITEDTHPGQEFDWGD